MNPLSDKLATLIPSGKSGSLNRYTTAVNLTESIVVRGNRMPINFRSMSSMISQILYTFELGKAIDLTFTYLLVT